VLISVTQVFKPNVVIIIIEFILRHMVLISEVQLTTIQRYINSIISIIIIEDLALS